MRHPDDSHQFLMSRSLAPALVTAHDIMEFSLAGESCEARGRTPFIERHLHAGIYRKRPDVMAIAHGHSAAVIPFGLVPTPMRATYHNAAFLAAGVPVFDIREKFGATDIVISDADKGAALAEALGDKAVLLLRAHGFVAVAPSLQAAVFRAIFTEVSARVQLQAAALGGPIAALDEEEGRKADAINLATVGRSWELWKSRVR
jgi:HCOMODA/2-hydroxy-3-carboxy-muconic semialdehyde decarboxylase